MRHRYLLDERDWTIEGIHTDADGMTLQASGRAAMRHTPEVWTLETTLTLTGVNAQTLPQRISILPMDAKGTGTTWRSKSPLHGMLEGRYTLVNDTILCTYHSIDKRYSGTEAMILMSDDRYVNRGALYQGSQLVATWSTLLTPVTPVGAAP
jgi:hypothetical protein